MYLKIKVLVIINLASYCPRWFLNRSYNYVLKVRFQSFLSYKNAVWVREILAIFGLSLFHMDTREQHFAIVGLHVALEKSKLEP